MFQGFLSYFSSSFNRTKMESLERTPIILWRSSKLILSTCSYTPAGRARETPAGDEISATFRKISPIPELYPACVPSFDISHMCQDSILHTSKHNVIILIIQDVLSSMLHAAWNRIMLRCVALGVDSRDTTQC